MIRVAPCCVVFACAKTNPYACTAASQCELSGAGGQCIAGYCAFPDGTCTGGLRYEANAGGGLAGTCATSMVDAGAPDAPIAARCVTDVAFGRRFMCVLKTDHSAWCSGEDSRGQLGFGLAGVPSATPMQVRDSTSAVITDAIAISGGAEDACLVRMDGSVWCWGSNDSGTLGNGAMLGSANPPQQPAAVRVVTANGPLANIVEVGGGWNYNCARDGSGGVWCWGDNSRGQLGDGTTASRSTAAPVLDASGGAAFTGAQELAYGGGTTCARKANNDWWCWGQGNNGQFGDSTPMGTTPPDHPSPVMLANSSSLALGMWHTCYVESDSTITCFGASWHARLGDGTGNGFNGPDQTMHVKVLAAPGGASFTGAAKVAAGGFTCTIDTGGALWCWGDDIHGQVGTGAGEIVPAHVLEPGGAPLAHVDRVVAHFAHGCAHETSGEWRCWGRGDEGELGDGTFVNHPFAAPLQVSCP